MSQKQSYLCIVNQTERQFLDRRTEEQKRKDMYLCSYVKRKKKEKKNKYMYNN